MKAILKARWSVVCRLAAPFPHHTDRGRLRSGTYAESSERYDEYVRAELAIAQSDASVMVINARRLMENIGWNGTSGQSSQFLLPDGVHYTSEGAKVLAAAEVAAMMGQVVVSSCITDPNEVTLSANTTLTLTIGGTAPCSGYATYSVSQSLTLSGPILQISLKNGFAPAAGQQFKLLSWGSISGTFSQVQLPNLPARLLWDTSNNLYTTGTIKVAALSVPSVNITSGANQSVTLPASPALIALSLAGTGTLSLSAQSSNTSLLPDSGIAITPGCGSTVSTCAVTLTLST